MMGHGPSHRPDDAGIWRRRRRPEPAPEPLLTPTEHRLADTLQRVIDDRLDEGLRAIEDQAMALMREVATEIWRASARDVRPEQERIVSLLSRDQAIRSLIASSDERFQALAVRTARLEDQLRDAIEQGRRAREAMEAAAAQVRRIADSPTLHSVEGVRSQLELVERHIAETFAHIEDRERTLQESILRQVREHGELVANETGRIVEAMQGYVQGGAEAVDRLAQRMEEHAKLFLTADHDITERIRGIIAEQTEDLTEQIGLVSERVGLHGRNQQELRAHVDRTLEHRTMGLARLVRADAQALHRALEERVAELERTIQDQVMLLASATSASVERTLEQRRPEDGLEQLEERLARHVDDRIGALAKLVRSDHRVIAERMGERDEAEPETVRQVLRSVKELQAGLAGELDRRFQVVTDQLHRETQAQTEAMLKIAELLSERIDRLSVKVEEGVGSDLQIVIDRMSDAIQAMSTVGRRQAS
jgi:uncharacterized protein YukE